MSRACICQELELRRIAGIDNPFALRDLSPGINVIYGPNGVGKSRTVAALRLATWPAEARLGRDAVAAQWTIAAESWHVEVDGDWVSCQRRGAAAPALPLGNAQNADRYYLVLQDLLLGDGQNFAAAIARESAGGYDLGAAAQKLHVDRKPQARSGTGTQALLQAGARVREAKDKIETLRQQEQQLAGLLRCCEQSRKAAARLEKARLAVDLARMRRQAQSAQSALAAFPAGVEKLLGNELDSLHACDSEQRELEKQAVSAQQAHQQAQEKIAAAHLDGVEDDPTLLAALAERLRRAGELQQKADTAAAECRAADQRRKNACAALGESADEQRLAKLNPALLAELADLVQQTQQALCDLQAAQALRQWVGELGVVDHAAAARQGLSLLHQWLRLPTGAGPKRDGALLLAAALMTALAIAAAFGTHGWLAVWAPVGPLIYWLARRRNAQPFPAAANRVYLQNEFAKLGVEGPTSWDAAAVEEAARRLADLVARAGEAQARAQRWPDLEQRADQAQKRHAELAGKCGRFAADLGLEPMPGAALLATTQNLLRWQEAQSDCAARTQAMDELVGRQAALLQQIAGVLRPLGYTVADPAAAQAALGNLRDRWERQRSGRQQRDAATQQRQGIDQRLAHLAQQRSELFARAGLSDADETSLRDRLQQRGEYENTRDQLRIAEARVRELSGQLAGETELLEQPLEQLQQELLDLGQQAAQAEQWTIQATSIRTQIETAKKSNDLESALAQTQQAADTLREQRDADCACAAGWALFSRLRDISREKHLPEVFRRARDLFARVTQGRYRLQFVEGQAPAFCAIDTSTQIGHSLDQLSGGTRLQLLLCVRVAFVERQEQELALPLVLDEALANSDEERRGSLMEATLEIARGGRQIFCFTAQADEVAKWRQILAEGGVPHRFIDLAEVRQLESRGRLPLRQFSVAPRPEPPAPGSLSKQEYGQRLGVPGLDPLSPDVGGVHLWHLLDDMSLLHRLLSLSIQTWGQWRNLVETGTAPQEGYVAAAARANILDHLSGLWRIGRGKAVDRAIIADCPAISERFRSAITDLAKQKNGDARAILEAIDAGQVPKFRSDKAAEFRQYLLDTHCLDEREPLDEAQIRLRLLAAFCTQENPAPTMQHVDQYLAAWLAASPGQQKQGKILRLDNRGSGPKFNSVHPGA